MIWVRLVALFFIAYSVGVFVGAGHTWVEAPVFVYGAFLFALVFFWRRKA